MSREYTFDKGHGGEVWSKHAGYAQTVSFPAGSTIVRCSGQGGWAKDGSCDPSSIETQVKNAFENVERVLKEAGCKGWEDVYQLRSYHVDIDNSADLTIAAVKERFPTPTFVWTAVGVAKLADPAMLIELEVEAIKQ